jgi:hypothetical protein
MLLRILKNTSLEYIKYNRVRFKEGSKKVTDIFTGFFETTKRTVKGLKCQKDQTIKYHYLN